MMKNVLDTKVLKEARATRSISAVADYVGVSRQQMWSYENGRSLPPVDKLARLLKLYNLKFEDVVIY